jgi:hypothetical protein
MPRKQCFQRRPYVEGEKRMSEKVEIWEEQGSGFVSNVPEP